ncbi:MAG TPA: type VI secretion system membrane subunit TssM [Caulobacteraceae bacterium]|nr:type VI secretion system membrane subunit TssM [Caulobacteraceae bacterium]
MGGLKKTFGNWWVLSILTAVLVAVILALLLPLVAGFLRPWWVRLLVVLLVALTWGACAAWRVFAARAASKRLADSLADTAPDPESKVLAGRLSEALTKLKAASGDKRDYLYSRPWYVIIGPPGAGKTTALLNSGLRFPFSDEALKGVGGTRNLDFWFADEAVLVDTAGRYTSQDSDSERDRDAWRAFLGLLRKNRPLQPINGVLVAIGLDELAGADAAAIDRHAATVRRRLAELQQGLELSVPVYVVFTKADLIAGFTEFYDDLDVEGRRAVVGATFKWGGRPADADAMAEAFDQVRQALADRTSKRLQDELDARRRGLIVGFPAQVEALRARIVRFLDGAFPADAPEKAAALRGFYLTSGVQQGAPLDRILAGVAAVYDAPQRPAGQGRAYFINRLLKDVVFAEAGLVQTSAKAKARRAAMMTAGFAAIGVVSLLVLVLWGVSFVKNRALQDQLLAGGRNVAEQARAGSLDLVEVSESDPDLESSLSTLRALRALPRGYGDAQKSGPPLLMTFGLYQRSHAKAAEQAYQEALQRVLLPRILLRLERYLQDNQSNALAIYEPLKVYLMLGGQAPALDKPAIKAWVENDWATNVYPGEDRADERKELGEHLDALLADPRFGRVWPDGRAPLDGGLVEASRVQVQTLSLADRAYAILKQKAAASGGADWRADSILSAGSAKAFANGDQVMALTTPYFFTRDGFQKAYQLGLQNVQDELEKDLWVMGADQNTETIRAQIQQVKPGVSALYAQDYIKAWQAVVGSLRPANYFADMSAFGAATAAPPPLKLILLQVKANTDFSGGTPVDGAARAASSALGPVGALAAGGSGPAGGIDAGKTITDAFAQLSAFVGDGKSPAPVDDFIAKLKAAVIAKTQADRAGAGLGADAAQGDLSKAMAELAAASATAPPMAQSFTAAASKQGDSAQLSSATGAISTAYSQSVLPACQSAVTDRYPFTAASQNDAPVGDLLRVFGLNGQIDSFAQTRLAPLMDTSAKTWRWRAGDPIAAALDPSSAAEFQRAAGLRDLLLSGVSAKVEAVGFGGPVTAVEIAAGGQTYRFDAGQAGQRPIQWTTSALPVASVTLFAGSKAVKSYSFEGPWALFRLFDAAKRENDGPTAFKATFGDGAASAVLRVTLPGAANPFSRGGVWSFHCPSRL